MLTCRDEICVSSYICACSLLALVPFVLCCLPKCFKGSTIVSPTILFEVLPFFSCFLEFPFIFALHIDIVLSLKVHIGI